MNHLENNTSPKLQEVLPDTNALKNTDINTTATLTQQTQNEAQATLKPQDTKRARTFFMLSPIIHYLVLILQYREVFTNSSIIVPEAGIMIIPFFIGTLLLLTIKYPIKLPIIMLVIILIYRYLFKVKDKRKIKLLIIYNLVTTLPLSITGIMMLLLY